MTIASSRISLHPLCHFTLVFTPILLLSYMTCKFKYVFLLTFRSFIFPMFELWFAGRVLTTWIFIFVKCGLNCHEWNCAVLLETCVDWAWFYVSRGRYSYATIWLQLGTVMATIVTAFLIELLILSFCYLR